jgi:dodecin
MVGLRAKVLGQMGWTTSPYQRACALSCPSLAIYRPGYPSGYLGFMFGVRAAGPHIREATKPGKLECKEAQLPMSVARVTELSATSETSFEDAINEAVARATKTLRGVEGCWVKDQNVLIEDGNIKGYKVNVEITFLLEE